MNRIRKVTHTKKNPIFFHLLPFAIGVELTYYVYRYNDFCALHASFNGYYGKEYVTFLKYDQTKKKLTYTSDFFLCDH